MMKSKVTNLHQRRKVNCFCRCSPEAGVIAMHPDYAQGVFDDQLRRILASGDPSCIADRAIRIGEVLANSGRPYLALKLMRTALSHLMSVEWNLQEDYAHNHYWPGPDYEKWYQPWSARVSEKEARQLAARIDELTNQICRDLGYKERSLLRLKVHNSYERMFDYIYEV